MYISSQNEGADLQHSNTADLYLCFSKSRFSKIKMAFYSPIMLDCFICLKVTDFERC